jgi:hypothetical protein
VQIRLGVEVLSHSLVLQALEFHNTPTSLEYEIERAVEDYTLLL